MKKYFKVSVLASLIGLLVQPTSALAVNIENPAKGLFVGKIGDGSFKSIFMFLINDILLPLAGTVALMFIIIGGYQYITSSGDEEVAAQGKKTLTNAVLGLVIVIFSYVIVVVVINALGKGDV